MFFTSPFSGRVRQGSTVSALPLFGWGPVRDREGLAGDVGDWLSLPVISAPFRRPRRGPSDLRSRLGPRRWSGRPSCPQRSSRAGGRRGDLHPAVASPAGAEQLAVRAGDRLRPALGDKRRPILGAGAVAGALRGLVVRPDVERLAVGVDEYTAEVTRPDLDDRAAAGRDRRSPRRRPRGGGAERGSGRRLRKRPAPGPAGLATRERARPARPRSGHHIVARPRDVRELARFPTLACRPSTTDNSSPSSTDADTTSQTRARWRASTA